MLRHESIKPLRNVQLAKLVEILGGRIESLYIHLCS